MRKVRTKETETPWAIRARRFPHILSGSPAIRSLSPKQRVEFLRNTKTRRLKGFKRFVTVLPGSPYRGEAFALRLNLPSGKVRALDVARFEVVFPSGNTSRFEVQAHGRRQKAAHTHGRRAEERRRRRSVCVDAPVLQGRQRALRRTPHVGLLPKPRYSLDHAAYVARLRAGRTRRVPTGTTRNFTVARTRPSRTGRRSREPSGPVPFA